MRQKYAMTLWAEWPIDEALKQILFSPPAQDNRCNIPAHLWPGGVAVLDEGLDADLDFCLDGGLGVLDEAVLLVVLVALLLLLRGVGRRVRGVASTVVGMVAQHLRNTAGLFLKRGRKSIHLFVILGLLHLLHLVYATLAGGGNAGKVDGNIVATLPVGSRRQRCVC